MLQAVISYWNSVWKLICFIHIQSPNNAIIFRENPFL